MWKKMLMFAPSQDFLFSRSGTHLGAGSFCTCKFFGLFSFKNRAPYPCSRWQIIHVVFSQCCSYIFLFFLWSLDISWKLLRKIPNWQMWQILTWRTEVGKAAEFGIFYLFYFFGSTSQSFKMSTSSLKLKIPQIAVVNYAKNECLALTSTNYIFQMWSNYKKIVLIHRKKHK